MLVISKNRDVSGANLSRPEMKLIEYNAEILEMALKRKIDTFVHVVRMDAEARIMQVRQGSRDLGNGKRATLAEWGITARLKTSSQGEKYPDYANEPVLIINPPGNRLSRIVPLTDANRAMLTLENLSGPITIARSRKEDPSGGIPTLIRD